MYQGYTESAEKIEARKRRILAGYRPDRKPTPAQAAGQAKPDGNQQGNVRVTGGKR